MAKKISKKKKSGGVPREKHYFGHPFSFIVIVGGGFVLVSLMLFMQGNPMSLFQKNMYVPSKVSGAKSVISQVTVIVSNNTLSAPEVTVPVGGTVVWDNNDDTVYQMVADDKSFDSGEIAAHTTGSVTFSNPGVYPYHSLNNSEIVGTVTVTEN